MSGREHNVSVTDQRRVFASPWCCSSSLQLDSRVVSLRTLLLSHPVMRRTDHGGTEISCELTGVTTSPSECAGRIGATANATEGRVASSGAGGTERHPTESAAAMSLTACPVAPQATKTHAAQSGCGHASEATESAAPCGRLWLWLLRLPCWWQLLSLLERRGGRIDARWRRIRWWIRWRVRRTGSWRAGTTPHWSGWRHRLRLPLLWLRLTRLVCVRLRWQIARRVLAIGTTASTTMLVSADGVTQSRRVLDVVLQALPSLHESAPDDGAAAEERRDEHERPERTPARARRQDQHDRRTDRHDVARRATAGALPVRVRCVVPLALSLVSRSLCRPL